MVLEEQNSFYQLNVLVRNRKKQTYCSMNLVLDDLMLLTACMLHQRGTSNDGS